MKGTFIYIYTNNIYIYINIIYIIISEEFNLKWKKVGKSSY